jgi:hypothetical protein
MLISVYLYMHVYMYICCVLSREDVDCILWPSMVSSSCLHIYIYICMYIHIYIYIVHIYTWRYIGSCFYLYIYIYIYIYIYTYMRCVLSREDVDCVDVAFDGEFIYTRRDRYGHAYICICTYIYLYVYIYICASLKRHRYM